MDGQIARLIIDSPKRDADLFYLTRIKAPDPLVWIQVGKKTILLVSDLEFERTKKESTVHSVYPIRIYQKKASKLLGSTSLVHAACVFFKENKVKIVEVPRSFPVGLIPPLKEAGFEIRIINAGFAKSRRKKKKWEVEEIRKCIQIGAEGINLAVSMIANSQIKNGELWFSDSALTSERIKREVMKFLIDHDCQSAGLILAGRKDQTVMPHHTGSGKLIAGDSIIMDFFPKSQISGYHGDITRTIVKGKPGTKLKKMYETVRMVEEKVSQMIKPGVEGKDLHRKALELFKKNGFETGKKNGFPYGFFHGIGHGLGIEIHEKPSLSGGDKLEEGDVITIEPGLYYPGIGGVRHENVYYVTATGATLLTDYEIPFEIP